VAWFSYKICTNKNIDELKAGRIFSVLYNTNCMIIITRSIKIDENEVHEEFIRASGPGGQNVNKVATAVQLRFDVANSPSLPPEVRQRLFSQKRGRINEEGMLLIEARRFRSQKANREDAMQRFVELIRKAAQRPKTQRKTRPTPASNRRRLESKRRRARAKILRRKIQGADEED
jgi:ribosome-associated protein